MNKIELYNEKCENVLKNISSNYIDLTITSPPYDNLRNYNNEIEWDFNIFKKIADELYRITKKGGVVVWIVGDATINGSETGTSFRQALYFKDIGFNLHDTMIYAKINPVPLTHNRYEQQFEYMFILSKGRPNTFNPIKIPCKCKGGDVNWKRKGNYENEEKQSMRNREEKTKIKEDKIETNIWYYSIGSDKEKTGHPAPFPEKLVRDHIITWSNEGDIILDPFMGSGTTGKIAKQLDRYFIGIEKVFKYFEIANKKIKKQWNIKDVFN